LLSFIFPVLGLLLKEGAVVVSSGFYFLDAEANIEEELLIN
jgi:hypothetical protein